MSPGVILDTVRALLDVILSLVPHDTAKQMLDDAAVRRANTVADAAELAKFGRAP